MLSRNDEVMEGVALQPMLMSVGSSFRPGDPGRSHHGHETLDAILRAAHSGDQLLYFFGPQLK